MDKIRVMEDPCWVWTGTLNNGYPRMNIDGAMMLMHRHVMGAPAGSHVHHLCGVRSCVNPEHLEVMTADQHNELHANVRAETSHCRNGHKYTEESSYIRPDGARRCRTCKAISNKKRNQ